MKVVVICILIFDVVVVVNLGYLGMFMGMVDVVIVLFEKYLCFDFKVLFWFDCDWFILFVGYGLMLIYLLFYFIGYEEVILEEIKNFCQMGYKIVGYFENFFLDGVEIIIGLLGQGIVNLVGFVIVEEVQCVCYGKKVVNYYIYVIVGDGCLMEGVS